jgi:glyoxylase-like metal-dependent hydrolase (beta-lactamase superfamily II)
MSDPNIEVVPLGSHVNYFYWGRNPDHEIMDMRLGGGAFAIHNGDEAIIVDTMILPAHADWVRSHMVRKHGVRHFTVVSTHWHPDHIAGNHVFKDCRIIGHVETRNLMLEYKEQLESVDRRGGAAFPVVPPNVTFDGRLDVWLQSLKLELHVFMIHERGHVAVFIPDERVFLAADMLEDPIWIFRFNFASPEVQLAEFDRMLGMDFDRIYACHASLEKMKSGGYDKNFIRNNANYLRRMLEDAGSPKFGEALAQDYIADALKTGQLAWWHPYAAVHKRNIETIKAFIAGSPTGVLPGGIVANANRGPG